MSSKLAPCPFCGEAPAFREDDGRWLVVCNDVYCGRGQDTASTQRKAANLWNRQWADIRARECLRLKRENEKHRRKTLKRWWLRTSRQYDEFTCTVFDTWLDDWYALNMRFKVAHTRKHLRDDLDAERRRNPELLRFLKWQDNFCSSNEAGEK